MHRRTVLLFILFLALAAFYATASRQSITEIKNKQQVQTEKFNRLDEQVNSAAAKDP